MGEGEGEDFATVFTDELGLGFGGQDSLVDKALDYRLEGTEIDPCLHHKRRSTCATNSFSM
jgi:hypothetical protein